MVNFIIHIIEKFSDRVNTRWAWFFTNGMKSPR